MCVCVFSWVCDVSDLTIRSTVETSSRSGYSAEQFIVLVHRLCVMNAEDIAEHVFDRLSASSDGEKVCACGVCVAEAPTPRPHSAPLPAPCRAYKR